MVYPAGDDADQFVAGEAVNRFQTGAGKFGGPDEEDAHVTAECRFEC